jgi:predicted nucleic acid-binding protein
MLWSASKGISSEPGGWSFPTLMTGGETGKVLARLAAKYDFEQIGLGRLTNDALMAMSAARLGITVITDNARDFSKLAEFRPFQWHVRRKDN